MLLCSLLIFSKSTLIIFKQLFQEYDQCHTVLDPDQARHSVGPDLGPNCLQRLSAEELAGKELNLLFV